jgi:hypothetical protein
MLQHLSSPMKALKEENDKLKEEIRTHHAQRERYIMARDEAYEQMRKELESQMEICKGKVIELQAENYLVLQAENYLVKTDLEAMTHRAGKNSQQKDNFNSNENEKRKRMSPGLQKQKELKRKKRTQVLKAFNWKKDTADPVLLAAACGFWDSFSGAEQEGNKNRRKKRVCLLSWKEW